MAVDPPRIIHEWEIRARENCEEEAEGETGAGEVKESTVVRDAGGKKGREVAFELVAMESRRVGFCDGD